MNTDCGTAAALDQYLPMLRGSLQILLKHGAGAKTNLSVSVGLPLLIRGPDSSVRSSHSGARPPLIGANRASF